MAPKKGQKMSLNEFLGDSALGSWADEMDNLPTAPAPRADYGGRDDRDFGGRGGGGGDRFDRFQREELPLPTQPPYTAFVGNLSFDCTESELESYFSELKIKSAKIIRDREDKPKGFGYVEFSDVEGLKGALALDKSNQGGRSIRVNVADPPKEREGGGGGRSGFGGGDRDRGGFDSDKLDGEWRRSGPLPPVESRRRFDDDGPRRGGSRFDDGPDRGSRFERASEREPRESTQAESNEDWRGNRPARAPAPELSVEMPPSDRTRRTGFPTPTGGPASAADAEERWSIGSKFKPAPASPGPERGPRPFAPPPAARRDASADEPSDWRTAPRRNLSQTGRGVFGDSPSNSTPPTPVLARRKLELTPRSGAPSNVTSPLGSPKQATATPPTPPKSNPFGAAKPVDVTSREKEVSERLDKDREQQREQLRESRIRPTAEPAAAAPAASTGTWRRGGPPTGSGGPPSRHTSRPASPSPAPPTISTSVAAAPSSSSVLSPISPGSRANVRPAFSFANAAKGVSTKPELDDLAEKTADISV